MSDTSLPRQLFRQLRQRVRVAAKTVLLRGAFPAYDKMRALRDPSLRSLHTAVDRHMAAQAAQWDNPYCEGYFYQGFDRIGILGVRPVEERWRVYGVDDLMDGSQSVLDIGCNAGFLALHIANRCAHVDAVELNPHLIAVAEATRDHLGISNVDFFCQRFEDFEAPKPYDVVLSFANHHTIDGNLAHGFRDHVELLWDLVVPGGLLLFETHNVLGGGVGDPGDDGDLDAKFDIVEQYFDVVRHKMVPALRRGVRDIPRLFVVLRRKPTRDPDARRTLVRAEAIKRWSY